MDEEVLGDVGECGGGRTTSRIEEGLRPVLEIFRRRAIKEEEMSPMAG